MVTTTTLYNSNRYRIVSLTGLDRTWVILTTSRDAAEPLWFGRMVLCWSEKVAPVAPSDALSISEVAEGVNKRVERLLTSDRCSDEMTYFPNGWDFWGGGVPAMLSPYRDQFLT